MRSFLEKLWRDPPHYDRPLTLMDYNVQDGMITGVDDLKDPPPNIDSIFVGSTLGVGFRQQEAIEVMSYVSFYVVEITDKNMIDG